MVKKILLAYDGSKASQRAFRSALELAQSLDAELVVLAVAQLPEPAEMVASSAFLDNATEHFEQMFEELRKDAAVAGIALETRIAVGHPAEQIIHHAAQELVDMIVMGHRGKSLIERWLLGSVSKRVISYAPCSVLVVR